MEDMKRTDKNIGDGRERKMGKRKGKNTYTDLLCAPSPPTRLNRLAAAYLGADFRGRGRRGDGCGTCFGGRGGGAGRPGREGGEGEGDG